MRTCAARSGLREGLADMSKEPTPVAEATADDRVEDSRLDLELKREQLRQAKIASRLAEQELLAKRIENERALRALNGPCER